MKRMLCVRLSYDDGEVFAHEIMDLLDRILPPHIAVAREKAKVKAREKVQEVVDRYCLECGAEAKVED